MPPFRDTLTGTVSKIACSDAIAQSSEIADVAKRGGEDEFCFSIPMDIIDLVNDTIPLFLLDKDELCSGQSVTEQQINGILSGRRPDYRVESPFTYPELLSSADFQN